MINKYAIIFYIFALVTIGLLIFSNYSFLQEINELNSKNARTATQKTKSENIEIKNLTLKEISDKVAELENRISQLEILFQNSQNKYEDIIVPFQNELLNARKSISKKIQEHSEKLDNYIQKISSEDIKAEDIPPELKEKITNTIHSERKKQFSSSIKKQAFKELESLKAKLNLTDEQLKELEKFFIEEILDDVSEFVSNLFEGRYSSQQEIWSAVEPLERKIDEKFKQVLTPEQYKVYDTEIKYGFYRSFGMIEEQSRQ